MAFTLEENAERQAALYSYLLSRKGWTKQETVTNELFQFYPIGYHKNYHASGAARLLCSDCQAINEDPSYSKIIIHGNRGIKLADEYEFSKFLSSEYAEVFKKLKRIRTIAKKASLDQQISLDEDIIDSFMDTFSDEPLPEEFLDLPDIAL